MREDTVPVRSDEAYCFLNSANERIPIRAARSALTCRSAGASVINCCYATKANLRGVKVTGLAEIKSTKMTFFGKRKNILDEKIPLKVSGLVVNPACMAGVLTSPPNFNARCGLTKL